MKPLDLALCFIRTSAGADTFAKEIGTWCVKSKLSHSTILRPNLLPVVPALDRLIWPAPKAHFTFGDIMGLPYANQPNPLVCFAYHLFDGLTDLFPTTLAQRLYHRAVIKYQDLTLRNAHTIVAISHFTARQIKERKGLNARVIYPGIDCSYFKPSEKTRPASNTFKLFFAGNLIARKGADLLPAIMQALGPRYELRFTGGLRSGQFDNLPHNMHALGNLSRSDLLAEYQNCDAFLFPSRLEGFGLSVAEAMACGKPVITTDYSSLPELISNQQSGLLCPRDNVEAFIESIRLLRTSPELATKLGSAAREKIISTFTIELMQQELNKLYSDLTA